MTAGDGIRFLTPEQRERWEADGYLLLRGALAPGDVAALRGAVERMYGRYLEGAIENLSRDRETATVFPPHWDWIDPAWDRRAIAFRRWNIVQDEEVFLRLADHPAFFGAVLDILGPHVQVAMTHAIVLPPGMKDKPYLHVDGGDALQHVRVSDGSLPLLVKVQMFLTDLDQEDCGNFTVVPGSHRHALPPDPLGAPPPGTPKPVQIKAKAGDLVIFTHSLWHGAAANGGDRARMTLIYGYNHRCMRPYDYERPDPAVLAPATPRQRLLFGDMGGWHWRAGCYHYAGPDQVPTMMAGAPAGPEPSVPA